MQQPFISAPFFSTYSLFMDWIIQAVKVTKKSILYSDWFSCTYYALFKIFMVSQRLLEIKIFSLESAPSFKCLYSAFLGDL